MLGRGVINLNDVVTNLQKMLPHLIGEDIAIQTGLAPDLGPVKADPGQLEHVLMNLAANARDAMPAGGNLILETINVHLEDVQTGPHFRTTPGSYALLAV